MLTSDADNECFDRKSFGSNRFCQFCLSYVPVCRCAEMRAVVVPRGLENIQNSNPAGRKYSAFSPSPSGKFLGWNNFSVCLHGCIMFRSCWKANFCLIRRNMSTAVNFLGENFNSSLKELPCDNDCTSYIHLYRCMI